MIIGFYVYFLKSSLSIIDRRESLPATFHHQRKQTSRISYPNIRVQRTSIRVSKKNVTEGCDQKNFNIVRRYSICSTTKSSFIINFYFKSYSTI